MKIYLKRACALLLLCFCAKAISAQDFIRIGLGSDFRANTFVQTVSFDLNRTEKVDEKAGRFWIYTRTGGYVAPSMDLNLGKGVTSSENNVLLQVNAGKRWFGELKKNAIEKSVRQFNRALEVNPSMNTDKNYNEKLFYGQLKYIFNHIKSWDNADAANPMILKEFSMAFGPFTNIGYRNSNTLDKDGGYNTAGVFVDTKWRNRKKFKNGKDGDNWVLKLTGNYYRILNDVDGLTTDDYGGLMKFSIDKGLSHLYNLSLGHKYGNDNPGYAYVHTLELSLKIKY